MLRQPKDVKIIDGKSLEDLLEEHAQAILHPAKFNKINLVAKDLSNIDLKGKDLRFIDFSHSNLDGSNLSQCNLDYCIFNYTDFENTTIVSSSLKRIEANYARFINVDFTGSDFNSSIILNSKFNYSLLINCNFTDSILCGSEFYKSDLDKSILFETVLERTYISNCSNIPYIPLKCPSDGKLTGWMISNNRYLVQIKLLNDSKRDSDTFNVCRCDKCIIMDIFDLQELRKVNRTFDNILSKDLIIGEKIVFEDYYKYDRFTMGNTGIKFYINMQDAKNYYNSLQINK